MPGENELNALALLEREHEIGVFLTGDTEDVFDALVLEALDEQV